MTLILSEQAERDLIEIYQFIAADSRQAADRVLDRLLGLFDNLAQGRLNGPRVHLRSGEVVQRWSFPPYVIYYQRDESVTAIVRVYHQARRPIEG